MTGKRDDGYHLLDSLVVFAQTGDLIQFEPADGLHLSVDGPFAGGVPTDDRNLVLKIAKKMQPVGQGARINLTKNLPHGGGIGGGSSDAAATALGLSELWGVMPPSLDDLLSIGADVPVCMMAPHAAFMRGIGERLEPAPALPLLWCVLVNPMAHVPTGDVFRHLSSIGKTANAPLELLDGDFAHWLKRQRNDLTQSTTFLVPPVAHLLDELAALQPLHSNMSGSGSTCWALFETKKAAEHAAAHFKDRFWTLITPIGG